MWSATTSLPCTSPAAGIVKIVKTLYRSFEELKQDGSPRCSSARAGRPGTPGSA